MQTASVNRFQERHCTYPTFMYEHSYGPLPPECKAPQYHAVQLKSVFLSTGTGDNCCMIDGDVVEIYNFALSKRSGGLCIVGRKYLYKEKLYETPVQSSRLGIFVVRGRSPLRSWEMPNVVEKMVRLPLSDKFVVLPLLHMVSQH